MSIHSTPRFAEHLIFVAWICKKIPGQFTFYLYPEKLLFLYVKQRAGSHKSRCGSIFSNIGIPNLIHPFEFRVSNLPPKTRYHIKTTIEYKYCPNTPNRVPQPTHLTQLVADCYLLYPRGAHTKIIGGRRERKRPGDFVLGILAEAWFWRADRRRGGPSRRRR